MGITSDLLRISVRGTQLGQQSQVIQSYACGGAGLLTASCENVANAFWQYIKDDWRACHSTTAPDLTQSVLVEEIGGSLGFGEYAIPISEQQGTRVVASEGSSLPPYAAVAARLTVATRVTRPGQKRFWGVTELDNNNGVLQAALLALTDALLSKWTLPIGLSTPADIVQLNAQVVHYDRVTGEPGARQMVAGYIINNNLSTQNSRKIGRGV